MTKPGSGVKNKQNHGHLNELESTGNRPVASTKYLTAPLKTTKMPPGVPYIVGNEAAERFSYYGMRAILFVFMTKYLMGANGLLTIRHRPRPPSSPTSFLLQPTFFL